MKILRQITFAVLLTLSCIKVNAQTLDTITAVYNDTIYSGYNAVSCAGGGCLYTLPVVLPPNFRVTDVIYTFTYRGLGSCWLGQGGFTISLGACQTSCKSCAINLPGLCQLIDISLYSSVNACLPTPNCIADTLNFVLDFFRLTQPGAGCSFSCIVEDTLGAWSVSVIGKRDTCATSIIEHQNPHSVLSIYPNPVNTEVTLHCSSIHPGEAASASIINLVGETLLQKEIKWSSEEAINIKELPPGIYFVQVTDDEGKYIGRFVKE